MNFNFEDYKDCKCAIHIKSLDELKHLFRVLNKAGFRRDDGAKYTDKIAYAYYARMSNELCINFNLGTYCNYDWYIQEKFIVLEFSDFEWDGDDDQYEIWQNAPFIEDILNI